MDIKKLAEDLLNKSTKLDDLELSKEQVIELEKLFKSMKKTANINMKADGIPPSTTVQNQTLQMSSEVVKFDKSGQWKVEKSNTLNYGKMNEKPDYDKIESEAHTLNYKDMKAPKSSKAGAGAIARRDAVRDKINTKPVEPTNPISEDKTAINTIKQRQNKIKP